MLCVAKVRPGGHDYYLEVVQTGVETPGRWVSAGAERLGLRGLVTENDIAAVLAGADPTSGSQLGRFHHRVKVAGFDLTFCAPKSVSLLHGLGAPDVSQQVRAGHESAVNSVVGYVERRALAVRRKDGPQLILAAPDGVAAGAFVHRTSRALDPHLHTHVVVANLGMAPDGTWSALDGRGVYAHVATAGALYHAQLRHELTSRLGLSWESLRNGRADIAGIGPEARRAFSQRAVEIERHLLERGFAGEGSVPSRRAMALAGHATRPERVPDLAPESLRGSWERRAVEVGLSPKRLEAVLDRESRSVGATCQSRAVDHAGIAQQRPMEGTEKIVEGMLGDLDRSITRRDVLRAWCSVLEKGAPVTQVEASADRYIATLHPAEGWRGERDGPGVGERRLVLDERAIDRDQRSERERVQGLLRARGIRIPEPSLGIDRGLGLS